MLKHKLVREMNGKARTPQRNDLVMHILVSELHRYSTRPRQGTTSLKHKLVSELLR
jgi:hypothetical protein